MTFATVGEILDALSQFDRSTPVVKADLTGVGYYDLSVTEKTVFRIAPAGKVGDYDYYLDTRRGDPNGFDAIAL